MDDLEKQIESNLEKVKNGIIRAAGAVGRNPDDIKLVIVTKNQPMDLIRKAIEAGARVLGENYPEEGVKKIIAMEEEIAVEWHMIGHVQSRKAELVALNFNLLHSLDGIKLARRLEKILAEAGKCLRVLLEFNVGGEESKFGWKANETNSWSELLPEIAQILEFQHLEVTGLMTMPPYDINPEGNRVYFSKLRKLMDFMKRQFPYHNWFDLSMGTSTDYEIAVEEGATLVRIGQKIFGQRIIE
jgi:pyridoxal phosphate enzyme (YggS family)